MEPEILSSATKSVISNYLFSFLQHQEPLKIRSIKKEKSTTLFETKFTQRKKTVVMLLYLCCIYCGVPMIVLIKIRLMQSWTSSRDSKVDTLKCLTVIYIGISA